MKFPQITISGKPDDRGYAHGEALSSKIEATIDFYARIFKKSSAEILDLAKHFRSVIYEYNPAYCEEIEGCLLYTSPSPRDKRQSRMPSSA